MSENEVAAHEVQGLSAGQLVLIFLGGVAVCALFFSAGFLVGYNERLTKAPAVTEQVSPPSDIPPVVNNAAAPSGNQSTTTPAAQAANPDIQSAPAPNAQEAPATEVTHPEPVRPEPLAASQPPKQAPPPEVKAATNAKPTEAPPSTPPAPAPTSAKAEAPAGRGVKAESPAQAEGPSGTGPFVIQVAATNQHDAERIVAALKALEYPVNLVTPEQAKAGDNLYRVQVGPFDSHDAAERIRQKLIQDGFKAPFIKH